MAVPKRVVQLFIELQSEDPEATSAHAVARGRLAAGRGLEGVRRYRVFEIAGSALEAAPLSQHLHGSAQFYNPAKERCVLRTAATDPGPGDGHDALVLVFERGGERRATAERWWRHAGGERVEVREGVVWGLRFGAGEDAAARAEELAVVRSRAQGLFANPHVEEHRVCSGGAPPLGWMTQKAARAPRRSRRAT
jgi:hypothetical protein